MTLLGVVARLRRASFLMTHPHAVRSHALWAVLILWASSLLAGPASAQNLRTQTYGELGELPSAEVADLALAPDGRMAFATRSGVGIFDGAVWEHHLPVDGLPLIHGCRQLEYDSRGGLWVVGRDMYLGVAILNNGAWRHLQPTVEVDEGVRVRDLALVEVDGQVTAAIVSQDFEVLLCGPEGWHWLEEADGTRITGVFDLEARGESLLALTSTGLRSIDLGEMNLDEWTSCVLPEGQLRAGRFSRSQAGDPLLWLFGNGWLGRIEGGEFQLRADGLTDFSSSRRSRASLHEDGQGGVYFGDSNYVLHYVASTGEVRAVGRSEGLAGEGTYGFELDREGSLWIASARGVTRIPRQIFESFDSRQGLIDDEVTAILELTPGELILGQIKGLTYFTGKQARVQPFADPEVTTMSRVRALDMHVGSGGSFWVATSELGAARFTPGAGVEWFDAPEHLQVNSVLEDRDGVVWVATGDGLFHLDPQTGEYSLIESVGERAVRRVYEGPTGDLFVGTSAKGLYRWRRSEGRLAREPQHLTSDEEGGVTSVYSILELRSGRTMVATRGGLFEIDGDRLVRSPEQVSPGLAVFSLLEDSHGRLWAGTSRGIERWDGVEHRHYGMGEGLAGQETNRAAAFEDSLGRIWFGTDRGLSLYCEEVDMTPAPLEVCSITERVGGAEPVGTTLPPHSDLEFEVRLVHFEQDGPRLRTRLLGYESEWRPEHPVGDQVVRYTNLPAGEYTLEIQARRAGREWGPSSFSRRLTIELPIYRRPWFLMLCLAGAVLLIVGTRALIGSLREASTLAVLVEEGGVALAESERRYREMFTCTTAIQLVLDPESWAVIDANPSACRYFEAELEELIGQHLSELTGISVDELVAQVSKLEGQDGELVLRPTALEQDERHAQELRLSQYAVHGKRVIQVTVNDITTQLQLEQGLREAQKLRAIGELAGGVAHDFNNLLTAILGFSELILYDAPENAAVRRHIAGINEAGEQGSELVRQLLAFGRRQRLNLEDLDLGSVTAGVADLLQRLFDRRIEVCTELDPRAGLIRADKGSIERVLMNLALNARDAMPTGGRLTLRTGACVVVESDDSDEAPGDYVCLSVEDTGVGMDEESRSRMFEPFYTTKETGKGTGLGLSTVHGIVGQSGGLIRVRSAPGEGTCVELLFPALDSSTEAEAQSVLTPMEPPKPRRERAKRVLLVDDDTSVLLSVGALLRNQGHSVQEASGGTKALAALESQAFDLLLTDMRMPGLSGSELAESVRRVAPELPVLFMSGYHEDLARLEHEQVLPKPFSAAQLAMAMRIASQRGASSVRRAEDSTRSTAAGESPV